MCCHVKDDLRRAVLQVLERRDTVDYLVIETSGAADPRPVAATLAQLCRLDLVVTVVDGTAVAEHAHTPLFCHQLAAADLVLLNKNDLLDESAAASAEGIIAGITTAKIVPTSHGKVALDLLMDLQVQARSKGADTADGFLSHDATGSDILYSVGGRPHFHDKSRHAGFELHAAHSMPSHSSQRHEHAQSEGRHVRSGGLATVALTCSAAPLSFAAFEDFVARLTGRRALAGAGGQDWGRIWRAKGFVWCGEARKGMYEFHVSGAQRVDLTLAGAWAGAIRFLSCCRERGASLWAQAPLAVRPCSSPLDAPPFCIILMLIWRMRMPGEPKTQLVVIGDKVDAAGMEEALLRCSQRPDSQTHQASRKAEDAALGAVGGATWSQALEAIRSDPNFEVWSPGEGRKEQEEAEGFTGEPPYVILGLQETDEMRLHGVYAKHLNAEVVSAVNAARSSLLLLPVRPPGSASTLMMLCSKSSPDAGGMEDASDVARWEIVRDTAYRILESKCIARCKCGF